MRRKIAFTLVELVIVVGIVIMLVSILAPALEQSKNLAKIAACKSNQKKVARAIFMYTEDNDDQLPYETDTIEWMADPFTNNLTWDLVVGAVPEDEIPENFADPGASGYPNQKRICMEGYIEFHWHGRTEGYFKCPAALDQIEPKSPEYWEWPRVPWGIPGKEPGSPTMAGGWGNCFSMNGNLSRVFREVRTSDGVGFPGRGRQPICTRLDDVRPKAVLIGDGGLRAGGGTMLWFLTRSGVDSTGKLAGWPLDDDATDEERVAYHGPWTHASYLPWHGPIDFYGHKKETAIISYAGGHTKKLKEIDSADWQILDPESEQ